MVTSQGAAVVAGMGVVFAKILLSTFKMPIVWWHLGGTS